VKSRKNSALPHTKRLHEGVGVFFKRTDLISFFVFLLGYIFLIRYWFYYSKYQLNSDAFVPDALAKSILTHSSLIPSEFAFANGDFLVYYHDTFLIFLNSIFSSAALAHNFASLILGTIFLYSIFIFVRQLGASLSRSLLILALVSTGISSEITDWLFGQAGYSSLITMILFFLTMFLRIISDFHEKENHKIKFSKIFLVIFPLGIIFLTNPLRFIMAVALPFFLAMYKILPNSDSSIRLICKIIRRNFLHLTIVFLPFLIFRFLFEIRTVSIAGIVGTGFRDYNNFLDGPRNTVVGAIQLLGILPSTGTSLLSIGAMTSLLRIVIYFILFQGLRQILALDKGFGSQKFVWEFTKFGLYLQIVLLMFTNISIDFSCGRYFLPQLLVTLLLILAKWDFHIQVTLKSERILFLILFICFGLASVFSTTQLNRNDYLGRIQLIQELEKLGVKSVNATYWNSARNQNLANNRIIFNTVYLEPGNCTSEYWWVNDRKIIDRTIPLVLTQQEYDFVVSTPGCVDSLSGASVQKIPNYYIILKN
jgi:hypothetical protein